MALEEVTSCPICGGLEFTQILVCKDFTTSGEDFGIQKCVSCSFAMTSPRPDKLTLEKYYSSESYISHNDKPTSLLDGVYFLARKITLQWKKKLIQKYNSHGALLDYGCGTGEFLKTCKTKWDCSGIEPSSTARSIANQTPGIFIAEKYEDIVNKKFDVISLWHVLEHVPDLNKLIGQLKDALNKNGTIFIAVPNYESEDAKIYKEHWAGYDVPRHLWHFSKETMGLFLKKHSLQTSTILPMKLDSTYVSLLSEKYKSDGALTVKGLFGGIYNGLKSNVKAKHYNNYSSLIYVCKLEA
jgi:2-polyprenyl-3-methyl-5-hydroxy-6-metoxy-1,4-benzoquinol methylase